MLSCDGWWGVGRVVGRRLRGICRLPLRASSSKQFGTWDVGCGMGDETVTVGRGTWDRFQISDFSFSRCVRAGQIGRWIASIVVIALSGSPRVYSFISLRARRYLISSGSWCMIVSIIAWTWIRRFVCRKVLPSLSVRARTTYSISPHIPICIRLGLCGKCFILQHAMTYVIFLLM